MKKRHLIAVGILLLLIAGLLIRSNSDKTKPSTEPVSDISIATSEATNAKLVSGTNAPLNANAERIDFRKLDEERRRMIEEGKDQWRAPINFFGKVVDEKGAGVPNVQISFGWTDLSPTEGYSRAQTTSDADGLFSLLNRTGKHLSVSLAREGYYVSAADNKSFEYGDPYSRPNPQPTSPVIFHLRKKGKAEPLLPCDFPGFAKIVQLRRDGTPTELNLATCGIAASGGGHLKLEFWGDKIERSTRRFNWKLRVSVPNGGLLETEEEFNFEAPETGYKPVLEINMPESAENWRTDFQRKFFIRLPDGKYGRIEFTLLARNGVFTVSSGINPSGSRNLEFDSAVQPKQTQFE